MKQILVILTIYLIVLKRECLCKTNQCPGVFKFYKDGTINYGIISIPPPGQGRTILEIEIGISGSHNGDPTSLSLRKSLKSSVADAERGKDIQYIYRFPQSRELPTIRRITLNHRDICVGQKERNVHTFWNQHEIMNPEGATQLSHIPYREPTPPKPVVKPPPVNPTPRPTPKPTRPTRPPQPKTTPPSPVPTPSPTAIARPSDNSWLGSLPFAETCGRTWDPKSLVESTHLIIGGDDVAPGEFPWLVALFHYKGRKVEIVCGATLISNRYVITAAHCTRGQKRVYLELGKHDISDPFEEDYIARSSINIIEHTEYVVGGAHGDVALIEIERVEFTTKVQPICLWALGTRLDNIVQQGTVTGWGRIENDGPSSKTPMKLIVRTAGLDKCRAADKLLQNLATDKTFCAGGNGTGPCHGDSGSGFYMRHSGVWYLRGVISTSLGSEIACNLERYAVYVDLTYFLDWMRPYLVS